MNFAERFRNYERWLSYGDHNIFPENSLNSLLTLSSQDGDSYLYYRWILAKKITDYQSGIRKELMSVVDEMKSCNENDFQFFIEEITSLKYSDQFYFGSENIIETTKNIKQNKLDQIWLSYYQHAYELNPIHEFLLILASFKKTNQIDLKLSKFKDKKGNLQKGAVFNYITSGFKEKKEINKTIKSAYLSKARNLIGHNNYKVKNDGVYNVKTNELVASQEEILSALYSLQLIRNATLNIISGFSVKKSNSLLVGTISVKYGYFDDGVVFMEIYQLWCFYRSDVNSNPLNDFSIEFDKGTMKTILSEKVIITGSISWMKFRKLKNAINKKGIICQMFSIEPLIDNLDDNSFDVELIDGVMYKIIESEQYHYPK